jgi:phosphate transport system substrate-binding protein
MRSSRLSRSAVAMAVILSALLPTSAVMAAQPAMRLHGSTTFEAEILKPHKAAIETKLGRPLDVVASKSSWGLLSLLEGRADVSMISAPLEAEIAAARKLKPDLAFDQLLEFKVATTRIAFPVHPKNPVSSLPVAKLRDILIGTITNWNEVGGPDLPILVVAVKEGGGTIVAVRAQLLANIPLAANAVRLESAKHLLTVISQEPGAIGISQLGLVRTSGLPEIVTESPIEQPLSLITLGDPSPELQSLIEITREAAADDRD